jgi:hypothetical protein
VEHQGLAVYHYDHLTPATHYILTNWAHKGYRCWLTTGPLPREKALKVLETKWPETYEIGLPKAKRHRRRKAGIPNALALGAPVVGMPGHMELILLATEHALTAPASSPFSKERWLTRCPELSDYVMVHEPRHTGEYAWTWRLRKATLETLEQYLTSLIMKGDANAIRYETEHWAAFYCMHGGVRRQLWRLLESGRKHWTRRYSTENWPGFDPETLPVNIGFKGQSSTKSGRRGDPHEAAI